MFPDPHAPSSGAASPCSRCCSPPPLLYPVSGSAPAPAQYGLSPVAEPPQPYWQKSPCTSVLLHPHSGHSTPAAYHLAYHCTVSGSAQAYPSSAALLIHAHHL